MTIELHALVQRQHEVGSFVSRALALRRAMRSRTALPNETLQLTGARSILVMRAFAIATQRGFPHIEPTARS